MAAMSSLLIVRSVLLRVDAHPIRDCGQASCSDLVAADTAEVIAAEVEEEALDQLLGVVAGGRIARAQLLVDLDEGLAARVGAVLLEGRLAMYAVSPVSTREKSALISSFVS